MRTIADDLQRVLEDEETVSVGALTRHVIEGMLAPVYAVLPIVTGLLIGIPVLFVVATVLFALRGRKKLSAETR